MHLPIGQRVNHRYEIVNVLGQGGFGITYLASDIELKRKVALKELFIAGNSQRAANNTVISVALDGIPFSSFVDRFIREARQIAQFDHENIIKVYEYFEANGTAYFAMEYVSGMTLQELVSVNGALSGQQATDVINSLLAAVTELHKRDVIHRDIKPANVMISDRWRVVLIDFGTARSFENGRTISTVAMVSSGYSPWEQYGEAGQLTKTSDVYAIGATMYFLLTGRKPLAAPDRMGTEMETPQQINSSIAQSHSGAVMKAMAIKPEHRFQSIEEFQQALKNGVPNPNPTNRYKKESFFNGYGRIKRMTYLKRLSLLLVMNILISILLIVLHDKEVPNAQQDFYGWLFVALLVYPYVLVLFQLSKRLQDIGVYGIVSILSLIPYVGFIMMVALLFIPGQKKDNKYGPAVE